MNMENCKLQIVIHSANGLTNVKNFGIMNPYVVIWVVEDGKELSEPCQTEVAKRAASSPVWDCTMQFEVTSMQSDSCYTLLFKIKHDGKLFDRDIGQVIVPFKDLFAGDGVGVNVSYPVKVSSGEVVGEIVLSHKLLKPDNTSNGCPGKKKREMVIAIAKRVAEEVAKEVTIQAVGVAIQEVAILVVTGALSI